MNAKQEILVKLVQIRERDCGDCGPIHDNQLDVDSICEILRTHTLEPVDDREFSPAILGWELRDDMKDDEVRKRTWLSSDHRHKIDKIELRGDDVTGVLSVRFQMETPEGGYGVTTEFPWPEIQSDGERLLKSLGVNGK